MIYFHASWVTISKVIGRIYFHAHSLVTISKVIGRTYVCTFVGYYFKGNRQDLFSSIFVGYYFKDNRQDLFSCIVVRYYFKGNRQDLFSTHSSVTISKVIDRTNFLHILRLPYQR